MPNLIYLLHFEEPLAHASHYAGSTIDLQRRLTDHALGRGARITQVLRDKEMHWLLARLWQTPGDPRRQEAKLKSQKNAPMFCPVCTPNCRQLGGLALEVPHTELNILTTSRAIIKAHLPLVEGTQNG